MILNTAPALCSTLRNRLNREAARDDLSELEGLLVASSCELPILGGTRRYINLDNAATTPALTAVQRSIQRALPYYGAVHRGTGFKSEVSTALYQRCRAGVAEFVGADPLRDVVVFGRSTTELINVLAHALAFDENDVVLVTGLEHHSNDLPWRRAARVIRVEPDAHGGLSEDAVEACLRRHEGRIKLLAVTGASNVTGYMPDIGALAELAHRYGAKIFVDAAQLVAHRPLQKGRGARELDYIAFSGHKMYAPFGSGALIGPRADFERSAPCLVGGGTISIVTPDDVTWASAPFKEEAGTPNLLGAIGLAQACRTLSTMTLGAIAERERKLMKLTLTRLSRISGVTLYGGKDLELARDRVGIVPFNIEGIQHGAVAEILSVRHGIAVRSGCFCAQPFVARLLGDPEMSKLRAGSREGSDELMPGMVRVSFGLCNSEADVEALSSAVAQIAASPGAKHLSDEERLDRRRETQKLVDEVFSG